MARASMLLGALAFVASLLGVPVQADAVPYNPGGAASALVGPPVDLGRAGKAALVGAAAGFLVGTGGMFVAPEVLGMAGGVGATLYSLGMSASTAAVAYEISLAGLMVASLVITGTAIHDCWKSPCLEYSAGAYLGAGLVAYLAGQHLTVPGRYNQLAPRNPVTGVGAGEKVPLAIRQSIHGSERLAKWTQAEVDELLNARHLVQRDGASVFIKEVTPGRYNYLVYGERGVVTAHKNWPAESINGVARNHGWEGWP